MPKIMEGEVLDLGDFDRSSEILFEFHMVDRLTVDRQK
jgi:hypothetical protein